jgi:hypothetical protein
MPYSDLEKVIKEMANYKKENKMKVQESNSKNETAPQNITTANTRRDNSGADTFQLHFCYTVVNCYDCFLSRDYDL